jgi:hypothetical protein
MSRITYLLPQRAEGMTTTFYRQITHRCRQQKKSRKEYGYRNDVEANDLFRKVKAIKSEQTMDGDILVLEERQAYNEAHQSHAYLLNMKQTEL